MDKEYYLDLAKVRMKKSQELLIEVDLLEN
jgi:hypothetical protein